MLLKGHGRHVRFGTRAGPSCAAVMRFEWTLRSDPDHRRGGPPGRQSAEGDGVKSQGRPPEAELNGRVRHSVRIGGVRPGPVSPMESRKQKRGRCAQRERLPGAGVRSGREATGSRSGARASRPQRDGTQARVFRPLRTTCRRPSGTPRTPPGPQKLREGVANRCWRRQRNHSVVAHVRSAPHGTEDPNQRLPQESTIFSSVGLFLPRQPFSPGGLDDRALPSTFRGTLFTSRAPGAVSARTLSGAPPRRSRPVYHHRGRTGHRAAAMLHGVRHRPSDKRRTLMPNDASMSAKGRRWFQMKGSIRQAMRGRPCRGGMCPPASAARSRGDLPHFRTVAAACLTQLRAPRRAGQALPRSTEAAGVTASMNAERRKCPPLAAHPLRLLHPPPALRQVLLAVAAGVLLRAPLGARVRGPVRQHRHRPCAHRRTWPLRHRALRLLRLQRQAGDPGGNASRGTAIPDSGVHWNATRTRFQRRRSGPASRPSRWTT